MNFDFEIDDFSVLSLKESEYKKIKHQDSYIKFGKNRYAKRNIFNNVEYDAFELQKLSEFKKLINIENFLKQDQLLLRVLYSQEFDFDKSLKRTKLINDYIIEKKQNWKISEQSIEQLKGGLVYISGRDKQMRPIINVQIAKIKIQNEEGQQLISDTLQICFDICKKYCLHPYHVEEIAFMIDVKHVNVFKIPVKGLLKIIMNLCYFNPECLGNVYILNPSYGLYIVWKLIEIIIPKRNKSKIKFIKDNKKLQEDIDINQIEHIYGGKLKLKQYWPPYNTLVQQEEKQIKKKIENYNYPKINYALRSFFYLLRQKI